MTKLFKDLKSITKLLSPYVIIMKPFILALLLLGKIKQLDKAWNDRSYLESLWK